MEKKKSPTRKETREKEVLDGVPSPICGLTSNLMDPQKPPGDQAHILSFLTLEQKEKLRKLNIDHKNVESLDTEAKKALGL